MMAIQSRDGRNDGGGTKHQELIPILQSHTSSQDINSKTLMWRLPSLISILVLVASNICTASFILYMVKDTTVNDTYALVNEERRAEDATSTNTPIAICRSAALSINATFTGTARASTEKDFCLKGTSVEGLWDRLEEGRDVTIKFNDLQEVNTAELIQLIPQGTMRNSNEAIFASSEGRVTVELGENYGDNLCKDSTPDESESGGPSTSWIGRLDRYYTAYYR